MAPLNPVDSTGADVRFADLGLPENVLAGVTAVGYEAPSPIQAAAIPPLLQGRDLLGQAQTGTGKTAAFALPILAGLQPAKRKPQALVLAPTRELAIQVAEAFQTYAAKMPGFRVAPIYGGASYHPQLSDLKRGVQVVVGTPGRLLDHLKRGSLDLSELRWLVLDEADEMLRMGFIEDVGTIIEATPPERQVALFSATMPAPIRKIAQRHLKDPAEITIAAKTRTADNIRQRYWAVRGVHKLDAMTRILETETFDALIAFVRTKKGAEELSEKLKARGFAAEAIHGDIVQKQRERAVQNLRDGGLDILVATDVAARGLDVERISHVLNYDIPYDTESYIHRIGRTGRAGRTGETILFVSPRERGMLRTIERATRQTIEQMHLPSVEAVNDQREARFMQRIADTLASEELDAYLRLIQRFETEHDVPGTEIAAALARMSQGDQPLFLQAAKPAHRDKYESAEREAARPRKPAHRDKHDSTERETARPRKPKHAPPSPSAGGEKPPRRPRTGEAEPNMQSYRIEVGHDHGVKPSNIVGAIANEADIESRYIGRIDIREDHSLVDLPEGMPSELLHHLRKVRVAGRPLNMQLAGDTAPPPRDTERFAKPKRSFKGPPRGGDKSGKDFKTRRKPPKHK